MSGKMHYKGRFMKKKVVNQRLKAVAAMAEAKIHKKNCERIGIGTRIVEVDELAKNLTCRACKKDISLKNIVKETQFGLNSVFSIKCRDCSTITNVSTGKKHEGVTCSDVNTKIALEDAAKDSCKGAAEEERRLVVENGETLCDEL